MKKSIVALMLVFVMLFTASTCFAEMYNDYGEYIPQNIDYSVFLNGEEIYLRGEYYVRNGDEVTIKVESKTDNTIDGVFLGFQYTNVPYSERIDFLGEEGINSKTYEASIIIEENNIGTKRTLTADAWLTEDPNVGSLEDDYLFEFYNFTWMPGENTVGSTDTTSKTYSYVMFEDTILSVNDIHALKPASIITIGDTIESENPDYIFEDYTIDLNGYTFTTANIETAIQMPDTASNALYTLRVFTRYHLASDESVKMVCWKTYSIVLAE